LKIATSWEDHPALAMTAIFKYYKNLCPKVTING
jgi:hypothetical protein